MTYAKCKLALLLMTANIGASAAAVDIREAWQGHPSEFAKAMLTGAGFSFHYGGKPVDPEFSSGWQRTFSHDSDSGVGKTTLTHESGLIVTRQMRVFRDADAIEYKLRFKNAAQKALPVISALRSLDLSFGRPTADGSCVISSGGGLADGFLPPRSFAIRKDCFAPTVPEAGTVVLTTEGGRSSNKDLPFFFVQNDRLRQGLFVAFGWSGQWEVRVERDPSKGQLTVQGRIPNIRIALQPGEEIQGPTILVGVHQGTLAEGSNRLRRLIRDRYTPQLAGRRVLPSATSNNWFSTDDKFDEPLLRKLADGAAATHQENFLLDAGWYAGTRWFNSVGNWTEINKAKLPNGLKPVADHVRSKGLKFGLWFEPERVASGSALAREHPEWILWKHEEPELLSLHREAIPDHEYFQAEHGLLHYGRPEVQRWVGEMMDRYIRDYDVKYIRYDFNLDPLSYWDANDAADRRGFTQLKHIEGLYAIIDGLRDRHPDVEWEACASGGRRIDLEMASRFHTFMISDHTADPAIVRYHLFGINHFLPGNYHHIQYILPNANQKDFQADDLGFQSLFGGAFGIGGPLERWPETLKEKARLHVDTWKTLRRYLMEDYYPLSAQPGDLHSWSGWQFHDPKDQSGFIQTFRTATADATHRFVIYSLDEHARYRFTDAYSAQSFEMESGAAMSVGIEFRQEPMSSRVLHYARLSP